MSKLNELMETAEMNLFVEHNQELIASVTESANAFAGEIRNYVLKNPELFIEADITDMKKNIRTFSEAAMCQYLVEVTSMASNSAVIVEPLTSENALNDYI